jgi:hypothetical protein
VCESISLDRRDKLCPEPRTHCGYARNISHRQRQYEKNKSSTWLLQLVKAAFEVTYPGAYHFELFSIAFLAHDYEIDVAERALTVATNSYMSFGGFCVVNAGACSSARFAEMSAEQARDQWERLLGWRYSLPWYAHNVDEQQAIAEAASSRERSFETRLNVLRSAEAAKEAKIRRLREELRGIK